MEPVEALTAGSAPMSTLRRLSGRRKARQESGCFVIDGPVLVAEALESGVDVVEVYAEAGAPEGLRERVERAGVPFRAVADGVLARVTSPVTPQAVAAVARIPAAPDPLAMSGLVLVLVDLGDPGNVGTLVRVAEAAGAGGVICAGQGVDVWNPKCVRASAGSLFRVPVALHPDPVALIVELGGRGSTTIGAAATGARLLDEVNFRGDVAVFLGNEAHGLAEPVLQALDERIRIPMAGRVESLNVAAAGSVIAFEAARQRRRSDGDGAVRASPAVTAHELRSPLVSVQGYVDVLRRHWSQFSEEEKQAMLDRMAADAERIAHLVDELAIHAQGLGDDVGSRAPALLDLGQACRDAVARVRFDHPDLDATVHVSGDVVLTVDRVAVAQVLDNLLVNAVVHGDPVGVSVEVAGGPDEVTVSVHDRGGRDLTTGPWIFDRGARGPRSPGSGLGLWIARGLVESAGGRMRFSTPSDGGTTVGFVLPRARA